MPRLLSKIILSFAASLIVLISLGTFSEAQAQTSDTPAAATVGSWYSQDFQSWYSKVNGGNPSEIFGERYTSAQVEWVIYGIFAFFINHLAPQGTAGPCISGDITACIAGITTYFDSIKSISSNPDKDKSLASLVFDNREISGISYFKEKVQNFSLVPTVHAQTTSGFGFSAFSPVQGLWRASRNFAYFLSIIATIILAFMIMFRVKISPQVVISAQSAIPKVIIGLIFVTFSYAIAGLLVDLMYIIIGALSIFLSEFVTNTTPAGMFSFLTNGSPIGGGGFLFLMVIYFSVFLVALLVTLFASGNIILNVTALLPIIIIIYILIIVIMTVVLLVMTFKILWLLLKTLAQTYLLVIVGPIQIMMGVAMPGSQALGIGAWMKALMSNLIVYPVVGFLFAISIIFLQFSMFLSLEKFMDISSISDFFLRVTGFAIPAAQGGWAPPLTVGVSFMPLIFLGVSFVILTLIPKSAEVIQGLISGKPFGYGSVIGEMFGPIKGGAKFGLGYYGGRMSEEAQEEYRLATTGTAKDRAKQKLSRAEALKSASNLIR